MQEEAHSAISLFCRVQGHPPPLFGYVRQEYRPHPYCTHLLGPCCHHASRGRASRLLSSPLLIVCVVCCSTIDFAPCLWCWSGGGGRSGVSCGGRGMRYPRPSRKEMKAALCVYTKCVVLLASDGVFISSVDLFLSHTLYIFLLLLLLLLLLLFLLYHNRLLNFFLTHSSPVIHTPSFHKPTLFLLLIYL